MNCPRCKTSTATRTIKDAELDICESCGGIFFDRGELNAVAEPTSGDLEYSTIHEESFRHTDAFAATPCPRCPDTTMKKVEFLVHTAIIFDYCEACRGFWLDGHELDRVNAEVRALNEAGREQGSPAVQWLAQFLFSLPR